MSAARHGLAVSLGFDPDVVTVTIAGDLDQCTAPEVAEVLRNLGERRHLIFDLSGVTFLAAAGLSVIAAAAATCLRAGEALTISQASHQVRRLMHLVDMDDLVVYLEPEAPPHADLRADPAAPDSTELVDQLARVASLSQLTATFDAAMRMLTVVARSAVRDAVGVSVTMRRHGRLLTVAASGEEVADLDDTQYALGEGPCVAAAASGSQVHAPSLADEERWSEFAAVADGAGITSILSSPLVARGEPCGAINIYVRRSQSFSVGEQELAMLFADHASMLFGETLTTFTAGHSEARIGTALLARAVIAQAEGVLMARHRVTAVAAAADIRRTARAKKVTVLEHATSITDRTLMDVRE